MNDFDNKEMNTENEQETPVEPHNTENEEFPIEDQIENEPISEENVENETSQAPAEPEDTQDTPQQSVENSPQYTNQWSGPYSYNPNQYPYSNPQNQYPYGNTPNGQYQNYYPQGNPQFTVKPPKKSKKGIVIFASVLCVVIAIAIAATAFSGKLPTKNIGDGNITTVQSDGPTLNIKDTPSATGTSTTTGLSPVEIYKKIQPSMVGVMVYDQRSNTLAGEGSGVIMGEDAQGKNTYIVTCAHVISDSGVNVRVRLGNGKDYDAAIVGFDARTDIGVLKIAVTGLTAAEFGNSKNIEVGQAVYAVGNSGGSDFFSSFTGGMVSGIDRLINSSAGYNMVTIQHDAAMSPGISGGALVNAHGQVIGINSAKLASNLVEGMNFSIPISNAKDIIDKLIAHGYVPDRPKLGIKYSTTSVSQMYSMIVQLRDLPNGSLIIREIGSDSDLANSNVRVNDLIIAVDGKKMDTPDVLLEEIEKRKVGDILTLTICRISSDYKTSTFDVKVKLVEDKGSVEPEQTTTVKETIDFYNPWG